MHVRGVPSWRLAMDIDEMCHVALYVRDSLRLVVATTPTHPPALARAVPDRRGVLGPDELSQAAGQWPAWWESVLTEAALRNRGPGDADDPRAWLGDLVVRGLASGRPPELTGLSAWPALHAAVSALLTEGCGWAQGPRTILRPPDEVAVFGWDLTRQVAEDVAFDRDLALDEVRGVALMLGVEGIWWTLHRPGVVLCSTAATQDPRTAHAVLRAALDPSFSN